MNKTLTIALLLSATSFLNNAFALEACPANIAGSCAQRASCLDLVSNTASIEIFQNHCAATGSPYSASPCASANLVGSCIVPYGNQDSTVMRMYAPIPANMVANICAQASGRLCQ